MVLTLLLSGCGGGGCFGLCSAADDDDDEVAAAPVDPSADLSCYTSGGTVARDTNTPYSMAADASAEQVLRYLETPGRKKPSPPTLPRLPANSPND